MAHIGIIGLGTMGRVHYEAYQSISSAKVVSISDADPKRAAGDLAGTAGNISSGGIRHLPMQSIRGYTDWKQLIQSPEVEIVDICLPTPAHRDVALAALAAGKHVICEKPMARTSSDARLIAEASKTSAGYFMPAMCTRFWPGWTWLKEAVADQRFGKVLAATFRRVASMPAGWYSDGAASGGALLDLHIHDVDFICYLFGKPAQVYSRGYSKSGVGIDHCLTQYLYPKGPLITAEGGWAMSNGFGFSMRFCVNFENATADFDFARPQPLLLHHADRTESIPIAAGGGYVGELAYFIDCVERKSRPTIVTAEDGVLSVQVCEAEERSIKDGKLVDLS